MTAQPTHAPRNLGVFAITMINIIAVDSLRTLPFSAEYGFTLVFYYLIAGLCFFLPIALISAELATGWPSRGGTYVWVREAFGEHWAFLTIWMQWIFNLIWFPTILVFIVETGAYIFLPDWSLHRGFILSTVLLLFWGATLLNCYGMRISSAFSTLAAIMGTLTPMILIISLGSLWLWHGNTSHVDFSWHSFLPQNGHIHNIAFLTTILFGLLGIEMSAVHADEVIDPGKTYPKAIMISTTIIMASLVLSSLAIAVVVPHQELNVINALIQAFNQILARFDLTKLLPLIGLMIILSGLGNVAAWIIGPTKGILVAARDGSLPASLGRTNQHNAPVTILLIQGIIFTILCSIFVLMPTLESGYWVLTAMTAQMALGYYAIVFAAGIALRHKHPNTPRAFRIPGGDWGITLVGTTGILCCIGAIALGFFPPERLNIENIWLYESILILGIVVILLPPLLVFVKKQSRQ